MVIWVQSEYQHLPRSDRQWNVTLTACRKFWKENLPRVQFHNPKLPIKVVRIEPDNPREDYKKVPAILKIHYADGSVKDADVKHKHSEEILEEFIKLTNAQPVA